MTGVSYTHYGRTEAKTAAKDFTTTGNNNSKALNNADKNKGSTYDRSTGCYFVRDASTAGTTECPKIQTANGPINAENTAHTGAYRDGNYDNNGCYKPFAYTQA